MYKKQKLIWVLALIFVLLHLVELFDSFFSDDWTLIITSMIYPFTTLPVPKTANTTLTEEDFKVQTSKSFTFKG